jgi:hypothetical protein
MPAIHASNTHSHDKLHAPSYAWTWMGGAEVYVDFSKHWNFDNRRTVWR